MSMIESVIFDWGGVLADDPRPDLMEYCARALNVPTKQYISSHERFGGEFQRGLISEEAFWVKVCADLDRPEPIHPSLWGEAFRAVYSPKADVFALVTRLHGQGYKTALLSNTEVPAMEFFYEKGYDCFDVLVFSCAEGVTKPQQKIYQITLERLGSQPERTVFIDDRTMFIEGAQKVGLKTILYKNIDHVRKELTLLGVKN
jgi:epoxide hydrolase-like predicted phosphatase